jgi:hypothetical protein
MDFGAKALYAAGHISEEEMNNSIQYGTVRGKPHDDLHPDYRYIPIPEYPGDKGKEIIE